MKAIIEVLYNELLILIFTDKEQRKGIVHKWRQTLKEVNYFIITV